MATQSVAIDLRSDTVTKPSDSMKQAIVSAPLGDDVFEEDPTVNKLQLKVAEMLGKEAALFVPSGTMANLIAGGVAQVAGVLMSAMKNLPDGTFDLDELRSRVRGTDIHEPVTMMVAVENTHSYCGGKVLPLTWLDQLSAVAREMQLTLHMDGARLFNASERLREEPARLVRGCDSVSVCFSKGLGAPVGSALAGTRRFIDQARRMRKMLGGGMRQAGVLAAAALVALDETVPSLEADHRRAKYLAKSIKDLKLSSFSVDLDDQQTNIVHVKINKPNITSRKVVQRLAMVSESETSKDCKTADSKGIVVMASSKPDSKTLRMVTHRDVDDDALRLAVKKIVYVLKEIDSTY